MGRKKIQPVQLVGPVRQVKRNARQIVVFELTKDNGYKLPLGQSRGAIVSLTPEHDVDEAAIKNAERQLRVAGAVAVKVQPRKTAPGLAAPKQVESAAKQRSIRQVVTERAKRSIGPNVARVLEILDSAMTAEGL